MSTHGEGLLSVDTPTTWPPPTSRLLQVERGGRDMNGALGLRPVFHTA